MYNHEYIRQKRIATGYSTNKMADKLKMDSSNYCKLETGQYKNVPLSLLIKLHREMNVDLYYLLNINTDNN